MQIYSYFISAVNMTQMISSKKEKHDTNESSNRDLGKTELGELDYHSSRNARLVTVAVN